MKKNIHILSLLGFLLFATPIIQHASAAIEIIEQEHQVSVAVIDGSLRISGAMGQTVYIYNVTGVQVKVVKVDSTDKQYELNLPKGCYIVKVGNIVRKIYIK